MNIVCVGDCGIDHYVDTGERRVGGISANFALQTRACFATESRIQIIAPLGDDEDAGIVRQRFEDTDIECRFTVMPGNTPIQSIEIDSTGERQFVGYAEGVLGSFRVEGDDAAYVRCADLLAAPVFRQNREMFSSLMAVERHGITVVDFSDFAQQPDFELLNEHVDHIGIGFFGLASEQKETIEALRRISVEHRILLVVTLGADGSIAFQGGNIFKCAAHPVRQVVDTTGAGDAFAAGFLCHYCRTSDIEGSLKAGSEVAAGCVQRQGAN